MLLFRRLHFNLRVAPLWHVCAHVSPGYDQRRQHLFTRRSPSTSLQQTILSLTQQLLFFSLYDDLQLHFLLLSLAYFSMEGVAWTLPYRGTFSPHVQTSLFMIVEFKTAFSEGKSAVPFQVKMLLSSGQAWHIFFWWNYSIFFHLTIGRRHFFFLLADVYVISSLFFHALYLYLNLSW